MAEVILRGVTKAFGNHVALDNVSMTIPDGSFVVLLGPTGAGKTTTLRMVSGLDQPDSGDILIGGQPMRSLTPAQRNVAMVFQQYSLYPHLTVRQNLEFPLKSPLLNTPQIEIERKVKAIAEILQISHKLDNKATALSGGEMQRVSIGRALVRNPQVYLMDEPLSSLDAKLRSDLRIELKSIQANSGATLLYVTHDQIEAMTMADKIVVLNGGKIEQVGRPMDLYNKPATPFVAGFIGSPKMNLYTGAVAEGLGCKTYGIRPEDLTLSSERGRWSGKIRHVERLGADALVYFKVEGLGDMVARTLGSATFLPGDTVWATPIPGAERHFDS